jgi:hypothetical protein
MVKFIVYIAFALIVNGVSAADLWTACKGASTVNGDWEFNPSTGQCDDKGKTYSPIGLNPNTIGYQQLLLLQLINQNIADMNKSIKDLKFVIETLRKTSDELKTSNIEWRSTTLHEAIDRVDKIPVLLIQNPNFVKAVSANVSSELLADKIFLKRVKDVSP